MTFLIMCLPLTTTVLLFTQGLAYAANPTAFSPSLQVRGRPIYTINGPSKSQGKFTPWCSSRISASRK
jgi:hypothetical protein